MSVHISQGTFLGGDQILGPSSSSSLSVISKKIYFFSNTIYRTENPELLHLSGRLSFQTGRITRQWMPSAFTSRRSRNQNRLLPITYSGSYAGFDSMSGFWSKSTGKLCMVGTGSISLHNGTSLELSAVFTLNYPQHSNISTIVATGIVKSLDSPDSPNHFDTISVSAYARNKYNYTQISKIEKMFSHMKPPQNLLPFNLTASTSPESYFRSKFKFEHRLDEKSLESFMILDHISFTEEGKVHMHIGFSNISSYTSLQPGKSLVAEGYWDSEKSILYLLACPVLEGNDPLKESHVGECTIGLRFWFPAVFTIRNRSNIMGSMWSTKDKSDSSYFSTVLLHSVGEKVGALPGVRYEYTRSESTIKACQSTEVENLQRYPDGDSVDDLRFDLSVKNGSRSTVWGTASPLSLGEILYGDLISDFPSEISFAEKNHSTVHKVWNVSYAISYSFYTSPSHEEATEISAEGIYNSELGRLCMIGCRSTTSPDNPLDCEISIDIQLSPMNQIQGEAEGSSSTRHLSGSIRSTRAKTDQLYFDPLLLSSDAMYNTEAREMISRMDMEIIMVVVSLTFTCIFIVSQLFHVRKHPDVRPSMSITMLVSLTLGNMVPLILNFEALFPRSRRMNIVMEWGGGWLEANEVIVRLMTLVAFFLQFRLLRLAWTSRSSEASKIKHVRVAERKALTICLPLYFAGALIAWFFHTRANTAQGERTDYYSRNNNPAWRYLTSYIGLILDGFLLPQICMNAVLDFKDKALSPFFYVGITAIRALPHMYDAYRAQHYVPRLELSYIYANHEGDYYSSAWDIILPPIGLLFAVLIFLQQRFGGSCLLPHRFRKPIGYKQVPVIIL